MYIGKKTKPDSGARQFPSHKKCLPRTPLFSKQPPKHGFRLTWARVSGPSSWGRINLTACTESQAERIIKHVPGRRLFGCLPSALREVVHVLLSRREEVGQDLGGTSSSPAISRLPLHHLLELV